MTSAADSTLPIGPGDVVGGKYRVERMLGQGGMGFVVAARHTELGNLVALKLLLPAAATRPDVVARFLREAKACVKLRSEHATRVIDVGELAGSGLPFIVMEYLEGASLAAVLRRGKLPVGHAVAFVAQACEAIEEAHALGIVHRDIKPDNLFVTKKGDAALVKVLDFGISQVLGPDPESGRLTGTADVMGTPLYMSPEQMRSARSAEPRSDVWALGATLFELLTGQPPFPGDNVTEICTRVLTGEPPRPRALRPAVPRALEPVVLRCLEKKPEKRFQTARELRVALAPFVYKAASDDSSVLLARASQADVAQAATETVLSSGVDLAARAPGARPLLWVGAAVLALAGFGLVFAVRAAIRDNDAGAEEAAPGNGERGSPSTDPLAAPLGAPVHREPAGAASIDHPAVTPGASVTTGDPTATLTPPPAPPADQPTTGTQPTTGAHPAEKPTQTSAVPPKPGGTSRFKPSRK